MRDKEREGKREKEKGGMRGEMRGQGREFCNAQRAVCVMLPVAPDNSVTLSHFTVIAKKSNTGKRQAHLIKLEKC